MTSTLELVKKHLHHSENMPNIDIYALSEPLKKKKKKNNKPGPYYKVSVSSYIEVQTFNNPEIFKSLKELTKELEKFSEDPDKSCYVTESLLTTSIKKCLCDKKYYSRDAIVSLIKNDFIPKEVNDILCECLLKYNDLDVLNSFKSHQTILSERMAVQAIRYFVRKISTREKERILADTNLAEMSHNRNTANQILFLLSLHFEDFQLQQYMKILSTTEAAVILQFLRYILLHVSPALNGAIEKVLKISEDVDENKVLSWIDCLVTAHLLSLTSSPSLRPLVKALQQTTQNQKTFYSNLKQLVPFIEALKNQQSFAEIISHRSYVIETIIL